MPSPKMGKPAPVQTGNGFREMIGLYRATFLNFRPDELTAQHQSLALPSDDQLRWLLNRGVYGPELFTPWVIRAARVRLSGRTFHFDATAEPALLFRAEDRWEVIDLIAWLPRTNALATWCSRAFCLGDQDQIFNPATWFAGDALHVHATPVEWLRAGRRGIVIVQPKFAHAMLRHCPRLVVADASQGRQLRHSLQPPKPHVQILVDRPERLTA